MFKPGQHVLHMREANTSYECFLISAALGQYCADILQAGLFELGECKTMPSHLSAVNGADGKAFAYMLSRELWNAIRTDLKIAEAQLRSKEGVVAKEPLDDFKKFLDFWDFSYEYDPAVVCPVCGSETEDWRTDPFHPFTLANANIGGLLVFHCKECGATIRQKHFKDKMVAEVTPAPELRKP